MNDSRVDIVAETIREAQASTDATAKLGLVSYAAEKWAGFAAEFPSTDLVIAVVTRRLASAEDQLADGQVAMAGLSLQVAANAVRAVSNR